MARVNTIKSKVIAEIESVVKNKAFTDWLNDESIPATGSWFVAINNSFLFRENIGTTKSEKYIAFDISSDKKYKPKKAYIIEGINFNAHYKALPQKPTYKITSLEDAIKIELNEIGEVIYTIVGDIQDINEISHTLNNTTFKKITLSPTLTVDFSIVGDEIKIKDYSDREVIWNYIEAHCTANKIDIPSNFAAIVDTAINVLQREAYSNLHLPKKFDTSKEYLLDRISKVLASHQLSYRANIPHIDTDSKAMVEVLRISYNFVSDVNKLLKLIVNICDLKPIVHWLTISKHIELDNKFKDLPFGFAKTKPSLINYESVIKNARNKSFHQLFPFNKALRFEVDALEKVSVTFFDSYGKKNANQMTYKDQDLFELLRSFTRVNEQIVSKDFWIKNEHVMEAVYSLIVETSASIKLTR